MQFLQDEFVNIAQSDAFSLMPKKYLVEALKSDFLQVSLNFFIYRDLTGFVTQKKGTRHYLISEVYIEFLSIT